MLDYLIVVIIFFLFLLFLVLCLDFFFLGILGRDQIFLIALSFFFLGILISTWYLFFFLLLTTLCSQASRSSLYHRDYQFLAAGLIEDEDHVDEPDVCHEVCLVLLGLYVIFITLILIVVVPIYLEGDLRALEEEVLLDAALLGDQGGEICPEADDREVLDLHGRLEVEQVAVEFLIDSAHVVDRLEVVQRVLVRLRVFDDVDVEDLADHVLPGPPLTHVVELLLELLLQILLRELVSFQLLEQVEDRAQREEQLLMLHEYVEFLVE